MNVPGFNAKFALALKSNTTISGKSYENWLRKDNVVMPQETKGGKPPPGTGQEPGKDCNMEETTCCSKAAETCKCKGAKGCMGTWFEDVCLIMGYGGNMNCGKESCICG